MRNVASNGKSDLFCSSSIHCSSYIWGPKRRFKLSV